MRAGRFFALPEGPADVEQLRREARALDASTRPPWLDESQDGEYRLVVRRTGVSTEDRPQLEVEIAALQSAGLVVETASGVIDVYIRSEPDYPVFAIGILGGSSPWDLQPIVGAANPILTRDDVRDVAAVFVADPFLLRRAGEWFLFFELLNWRENKGEIGLAKSADGLHWRYRGRVLTEPFHLSYPYVFEDEGCCYMVPEARQAGEVRLYRALEFPDAWTLDTTLIADASLADASLFRSGDRWWMLAGCDGERRHDTLRLFGADELRGPWTEHPRSPVVCGDPESARPAGRVLVEGGRIFRFSQCCHPEYGLDVRAFEILELSRDGYSERAVGPGKLLAGSGSGWNASGMHHIDAHRLESGSWLACVDGWRRST